MCCVGGGGEQGGPTLGEAGALPTSDSSASAGAPGPPASAAAACSRGWEGASTRVGLLRAPGGGEGVWGAGRSLGTPDLPRRRAPDPAMPLRRRTLPPRSCSGSLASAPAPNRNVAGPRPHPPPQQGPSAPARGSRRASSCAGVDCTRSGSAQGAWTGRTRRAALHPCPPFPRRPPPGPPQRRQRRHRRVLLAPEKACADRAPQLGRSRIAREQPACRPGKPAGSSQVGLDRREPSSGWHGGTRAPTLPAAATLGERPRCRRLQPRHPGQWRRTLGLAVGPAAVWAASWRWRGVVAGTA